MTKFKHYLLATIGLAILAGGLTLLGPAVQQGQAAGAAKDVNVVNTPGVTVTNTPLPITGDVNITNTSLDVNATQSGTWNVGITNDTSTPVPVVLQNGAEKELVEIVALDVANPSNSATVFDVYTVDTGKRLVITDVIVTNLQNSVLLRMTIHRDGAVVSTFSTAPPSNGGTYEHSYVSGIEFAAGQIVGISPGTNAAEKNTNWELRGYLKTL